MTWDIETIDTIATMMRVLGNLPPTVTLGAPTVSVQIGGVNVGEVVFDGDGVGFLPVGSKGSDEIDLFPYPHSDFWGIAEGWRPANKIKAIKAVRALTDCSLREAKDAVEIEDRHRRYATYGQLERDGNPDGNIGIRSQRLAEASRIL